MKLWFILFSISSKVEGGTTFFIISKFVLFFREFLIAVAEQILLSMSFELYAEATLVIVNGLIELFNLIKLFMYSMPKILLEEFKTFWSSSSFKFSKLFLLIYLYKDLLLAMGKTSPSSKYFYNEILKSFGSLTKISAIVYKISTFPSSLPKQTELTQLREFNVAIAPWENISALWQE